MSIEHFIINVLVALGLGTLIGLERQWGQHPAGLRTNALVALGAALFVSLTALMGDTSSPTRIASYVVSGLGFLGGGVILREGLNVRGLNTAATLWCTGAIGTLAGAGFPLQATIGTAGILLAHFCLRPLTVRIEAFRKLAPDVETAYRLRVRCAQGHEAAIRTMLQCHVGGTTHLTMQGLTTDESNPSTPIVTADIFSSHRSDHLVEEIVAALLAEPQVSEAGWTRLGV